MARRPKRVCVTRHAKRRLGQRYGLKFKQHEMQELSNICRRGEYVCYLAAQSHTRSKGIICYQGQYFPVIYHKKLHRIVTVLTFSMLAPHELQQFAESLGVSVEQLSEVTCSLA